MMRVFENLIIIGTSHIAKQSLIEVESIILKEKPEVVALELDKARYYSLITKEKRKAGIRELRAIGVKGFIFAKFGEYAEKKLGKSVGISPGDEMIKAAETASEIKAKIALIDQKIEITLKNFSKEITWKEKFRFAQDIVTGTFSKKNKMSIDLNKVPDKELIEKLLKITKERYPNFYKVLVEDRNKYMSKRLCGLMKNYTKIVAVVGAGHEDEIIEEIKNYRNTI